MRRLRVALGQINPTVGDFERNVRMIVDAIERARALGCSLVAFPELAVTGYPPEDLLFKPAFIEANLRALDDIARVCRGLTAIVGFVDRRDDIFNAAAVLHEGAVAGVYHKRYLPNYGVFDEDLVVADIDLDGVFRARLRDSRRRKEKLSAEDHVCRVALTPVTATAPPLPERPTVEPLPPVDEVFRALVLGTGDYVRKNR